MPFLSNFWIDIVDWNVLRGLLTPQNLFRKIEGKISPVSQFQKAVKMCRTEFEC